MGRTCLVWIVVGLLGLPGCVRNATTRAENWWRARTAHVELTANLGEGETREAALQLEAVRHALSHAFYTCDRHDDGVVVQVTIVADAADFEAVSGLRVPHVLSARDGLLHLPRRVVMDASDVEREGVADVFAHELTHDFVDTCFPDAPHWLHEGLAGLFETLYLDDGHVTVGRPPYRFHIGDYLGPGSDLDAIIMVVPRQSFVPPSELVRTSWEAFHHPDAAVEVGHYASAWALVHFLALGPDHALRERFISYLESLTNGTGGGSGAWEAAFHGVDLDREVADYLLQRRYNRIARPSTPPADEASLAPLATAEADLLLAEVALRSDRGAIAAEHLARVGADPVAVHRRLLLEAALAPTPGRVDLLRMHARGREAAATATLDELRALLFLDPSPVEEERIAARLTQHPERRAVDLAVVADIDLHRGRLDDAEAHVAEALALDARCAHALLVRGQLAVERGDTALARRSFHAVLSFDGHDGSLAAAAARALAQLR